MDLTELWWSLLGLTFLVTPFLVAALSGLALPASVVTLARMGRYWSDDTKLAWIMAVLLLSCALGVALSDRVLYTPQEYLARPALVFASLEAGGWGRWVSRSGTLLLALICVPELMRWSLGERRLSGPARNLLLAFSLYALTSVVIAGLAGETRGWRLSYLYLPLLFTGLALMAPADPIPALRAVRWCLWVVMVSSLGAALVSPSFALDRDYASPIPGLTWRLVGLTDHANSLGALAVVAVMLEISPIVQRRPRLVLLVPAIVVLLLAQSKTAWGEMIVAIGLLHAGRIRSTLFGQDAARSHAGMLGLVAFAAAFALCGLGMLAISSRAQSWIDQASLGTLTGRTRIWEITWAEFERSPWLGYGPALWDAQYRYEQGLVSVGQGHNQYIHTLGQAGVVGAVGLMVYIGSLVRSGIAAWRAGWSLPLVLSLVLLMRGITETPLSLDGVLSTDAFLHALAFCLASRTYGRTEQPMPHSAASLTHSPTAKANASTRHTPRP